MRLAKSILIAASFFTASAALPAHAEQKAVQRPAADTVEQRTFFSAALQRNMPYQVVLPAGYGSGPQRYAVLYLLHGWQGDETNWIELTHLVELVSHYPLILVTPRAANSWYVNSATHPADRYADYIVTDLIADVDAHYRTIAEAHDRAIAGLSMGGYGAMLFTLHNTRLFGFTGSISGAFTGPSGIEDVMPQLKPSTDEAFGAAGSATRRDNNLDTLIAATDPLKTPYLFLECGTSDPLLESNRHVVAELSAHKFAYEYHEMPGSHTWSFWDNSIPALLNALAQQFHLQPAPPPPLALQH